jgi:hypothetical protein
MNIVIAATQSFYATTLQFQRMDIGAATASWLVTNLRTSW